MATQSPGIYVHEYDNTAFENPKATSGTTVAIVGYAKKGPIGKPTMIASWAEFTSTFGKPIEGYYSGISVKNILGAGGTVLFTRVADSSASPSNYIVKNAIAGTKGYVKFARESDILIGTNGYKNGSIYNVEVTDADGNSKVFYVRSPKEGKFTQNSIYSQLLQQNVEGGTPGTYEAKINKAIAPGLYSFTVDGSEVSDFGDVFVNLATSNTESLFAEAIEKAIMTGSNATCVLRLSKANNGFGSPFATEDAMEISGVKKFQMSINGGAPYTIEISLSATDTFEDLAAKLNAKCSNYNVNVIIQQVKFGEDYFPALVFVLMNKGSGNSISISSIPAESVNVVVDPETGSVTNTNQLFLSSNYDSVSNIEGFEPAEDNGEFSVKVYSAEETANSDNLLNGFSVEYDENINSIIFKTEAIGPEASIEVKAGSLGKDLFKTNTVLIGKVDGQNYLNVNIKRGSDKKIYFESIDNLAAPSLSNADNEEDSAYLDLLTIEKNPSDYESVGFEPPVEGNDAVDASNRDMVVFTSKENGSATNNIVVEVYSSTSPVDGSVKHDLTIKVDGLLKETYENISYNYADVDNRFDTIINESADNGGSNIINVTVVKNDYQDENVQLPDGVYYIGKPNTPEDVAKEADVSYSAYNLYDYTLGTDGIPSDDGSALFEEAMKAGTSELANKDLYDFHILITPDDISEVVQNAAVALCEDREDAIAIIDPPIGLTVKGVVNWHNGRGFGRSTALTSNYAATYWPWCKIYENTSGKAKYTWVMPSVVMAAKYVTVDKTAGCWYAPAGEANGQLAVADIETYPNKLDRDEMYVDYNRVNPITKFKDGSIIVYGEKTLQRINSVLTKVHTRRMLVQIRKQCREALRGYIFMPNTPDYLGKISSNMTAILEGYKAGGGLAYYRVVCDETNNPTEIRQQDIVNVDVVCVPEGTIEEINISLTLNKSEEAVTG